MKILFTLFLFSAGLYSNAQIIFSSQNWIKDGTTISFGDPGQKTGYWQHGLNGLRIVYEPQLGIVLQNTPNRFDNKVFLSLSKIGFELNVYDGWVSIQLLGIAPSSIQFDEQSPLRINGNTVDSTGKVNIDYGGAFGLSLFDGMISLGFGGIFYDRRDFIDVQNMPISIYQNNFVYLNLQPISLVKAAIKNFQGQAKEAL